MSSEPNVNDYEYRLFSYEGSRIASNVITNIDSDGVAHLTTGGFLKFERDGKISGYSIHAVCKDDDGNLYISKHIAYPRSNSSLEALKKEVEKYQEAFNKPILSREDFGCWQYAWINWDDE